MSDVAFPPLPRSREPIHQLALDNDRLAQWVTARYVRLYNLNGADAEDVLQECRLTLLDIAEHYDPSRGAFSTYAVTRMSWAARDWLRRGRRWRCLKPLPCDIDEQVGIADPHAPDPAACVEAGELAADIERALAELPGRRGQVLAARLRGERGAAIAEALGVSDRRVSQLELSAVGMLATSQRLRQHAG